MIPQYLEKRILKTDSGRQNRFTSAARLPEPFFLFRQRMIQLLYPPPDPVCITPQNPTDICYTAVS